MKLFFFTLAAALVLAPVGWIVSDRLEAENDFCTSCHLPDGSILHAGVRDDFDRKVPISLAGVHGRASLEELRDDAAYRCIDCHGGVGAVGRARVKLLAARDALIYLAGDFEEPEEMDWPLRREDCLRCHSRMRGAAVPGWGLVAFHGVEAHDDANDLGCVDCHGIHSEDGDAFAYFLSRERVEPRCRGCHSDYAPTPRWRPSE